MCHKMPHSKLSVKVSNKLKTVGKLCSKSYQDITSVFIDHIFV